MKKIEEFDNYGIDLSRSAQHKTHPGGLYSILMVIVTAAIVGSTLISFFTQQDTIIMNYIFSFNEYPISPVDYSNLKINGSIVLATKQESISDLMKYFKIVFEYQVDSTGKTELSILNCKIEGKKCIFDITLQNKYFNHHYMNLNPSFGIESCKKLKQIFDQSHPLLADCAENYDEIYNKEYIQNNFLFLEYSIPYFEMTLQGSLNKTTQTERVSFLIKKGNAHYYISELNQINILYNNKLFSKETYNETYANWLSPRLTDPDKEEDYHLRILFSFRFKEDIIYYQLTKTSFFITLVNLGGFLKLISLIYLIPNIWNEYYMQKILFQVKELFKDEDTNTDKEKKEKDAEDKNKEKDKEEILDIDWSKISFCKWYWLTCCCNCSAKKRLIKKKYKQLLEKYQCKSYIRPDNQSKWFDISKLMLQEDFEINELLREVTVQQEQTNVNQDIIQQEESEEKNKEHNE